MMASSNSNCAGDMTAKGSHLGTEAQTGRRCSSSRTDTYRLGPGTVSGDLSWRAPALSLGRHRLNRP